MDKFRNVLVSLVAVCCLLALIVGGLYFANKFKVDESPATVDQVADVAPEKLPSERDERAGGGLNLSSNGVTLPDAAPPETEPEPEIEQEAGSMFSIRVLKTGLANPGGLAVHPEETNLIYIAEEDTDRVVVYDELLDTLTPAIDVSTPVYEDANESLRSSQGLRMPEGMCFGPDGYLYVAEDISGGRLIKFKLEPGSRRVVSGYVISLPGNWSAYSWEDVAVGRGGEILLAGSTAQDLGGGDFLDIFVGTLVYKDRNDNWWIPYERKFASFSSVEFSKSGTQAIITGELSGEISWISLTSRRRSGGNSEHTVRGAEGFCVMPDGGLLIGMEEGIVKLFDPARDAIKPVLSNLPAVEYVTWDRRGNRALVSDDKSGSIIELTPLVEFDESEDKMNFATYRSILSQMHIPRDCPPYLAEVLKLGGLDYTSIEQPDVSFREFTARVPMVAADAVATPVPLHNFAKDPIAKIQFVVFEPNSIAYTDDGVTLSLAGFYAETREGSVIKSSTKEMAVRRLEVDTKNIIPEGLDDFVVPHASSVTVSSIGAAAISFNGLGETPDYSIVINPVDPEKSYLAVFYEDGRRDHYTLSLPDIEAVARSWVVAYSNDVNDEWQSLSAQPRGEVRP